MHRTAAYIIHVIFNASYRNEHYHVLSCICSCIVSQCIMSWFNCIVLVYCVLSCHVALYRSVYCYGLTASFWCVVYCHFHSLRETRWLISICYRFYRHPQNEVLLPCLPCRLISCCIVFITQTLCCTFFFMAVKTIIFN